MSGGYPRMKIACSQAEGMAKPKIRR